MKSILMTVFVAVLSIATATAQWQDYTWEQYGLAFSVPSSHQLKQNKADAFESGDSKTWMELYPYHDASETAKGMIQKVAAKGGFTISNEGVYNSGGWNGYWVQATTSKWPTWEFWLIGFIDPNTSANFYSIIWWKKGNQSAYKIAYDMSYKFRKM